MASPSSFRSRPVAREGRCERFVAAAAGAAVAGDLGFAGAMIGAAGQSFTFVDSQMTLAAAALGQSGEVRETERKLFATREKRYVPAYDLAMVRLALADHAGALRL